MFLAAVGPMVRSSTKSIGAASAAGAQQQGLVGAFLHALQAGGLEIAIEHALDGGDRDHLLVDAGGAHFLAIDELHFRHALDVDHRHRLANVVALV